MTTSRAARFGAALAMLWAAHDVADHIVQTDHQAAEKSRDWSAMAGHVGGYTAVQVAALAALRPLGVRPPLGRLAAAVAWSAGTHAFLDRRWPVRRALELTRSPRFADPTMTLPERDVLSESPPSWQLRTNRPAPKGRLGGWLTLHGTAQEDSLPVPLHGPYLADQALHHACLTVSALILAGGWR